MSDFFDLGYVGCNDVNEVEIMKDLEEMTCYYFTCSAELLEQLDAFKNQDKKVINIEDKTFYFYLYEEECTGTMEFLMNLM